MEQPKTPGLPVSTAAVPSPSPASKANNGSGAKAESASKKLSPPTPEELVAHYEAQGLEPREASLRVIRDLQTILYRAVAPGRVKKERFVVNTARKLDNVHTRLAIIEMKLDTKPGCAELFAIGVAAGSALQGGRSAAPHILGAFGNVWGAVRSATKGHSSSP